MYMRRSFSALALVLAVAFSSLCLAAFPDKPITLIVPFPPGGPTDSLARIIGQHLSKELGGTIIVDNRGGAGGVVATQAAANSKPDGYTLFFATTGTMAINPALYKNTLKIDPLKAFDPIGTVVQASNVLIVNKDSPFSSVGTLIAAAKVRPGEYTFASSGNGGVIHLTGQLFREGADINITHVPYKGSAPAITDIIGGNVTMMFDVTAGAMPFILSGKVKAIAVTSSKRIKALPNVPTVAESGLPNFESSNWFGLVAPKGLTPEVLAKLNGSLQKVLANPEVQKQIVSLGSDVFPGTPNDFAKLLQQDTVKWSALVKSSGATID